MFICIGRMQCVPPTIHVYMYREDAMCTPNYTCLYIGRMQCVPPNHTCLYIGRMQRLPPTIHVYMYREDAMLTPNHTCLYIGRMQCLPPTTNVIKISKECGVKTSSQGKLHPIPIELPYHAINTFLRALHTNTVVPDLFI